MHRLYRLELLGLQHLHEALAVGHMRAPSLRQRRDARQPRVDRHLQTGSSRVRLDCCGHVPCWHEWAYHVRFDARVIHAPHHVIHIRDLQHLRVNVLGR